MLHMRERTVQGIRCGFNVTTRRSRQLFHTSSVSTSCSVERFKNELPPERERDRESEREMRFKATSDTLSVRTFWTRLPHGPTVLLTSTSPRDSPLKSERKVMNFGYGSSHPTSRIFHLQNLILHPHRLVILYILPVVWCSPSQPKTTNVISRRHHFQRLWVITGMRKPIVQPTHQQQ